MSRTEPRPTKPAYVHVADTLRDRIVSGEIPPGEFFPSEAQLQDEFGVSRSTIREALRMLASQRLVTTLRGVRGGTRVAEPSHVDIKELLGVGLRLLSVSEECSPRDLLEVRKYLEVPAARLAAVDPSDEFLAGLRACVPDEDVDPTANLEQTYEFNRRFHELMLEASGNRLLETLASPVLDVVRNRFADARAQSSFSREVFHDHRMILRALEARDAEAAAAEMAVHLNHVYSTYLPMID